MIKMNEKKLIEILKDNIPDDYIRGCDTTDGIGKYITDKDSWQYQLYVYVSKLQNNWNELKKWLEEEINICDGCIDTMQSDLQEIAPRGSGKSYLTGEIFKNKVAKRSFEVTSNKMQELEGNNDR